MHRDAELQDNQSPYEVLIGEIVRSVDPLLVQLSTDLQHLVVRVFIAALVSWHEEGPGPVHKWALKAWGLDERRFATAWTLRAGLDPCALEQLSLIDPAFRSLRPEHRKLRAKSPVAQAGKLAGACAALGCTAENAYRMINAATQAHRQPDETFDRELDATLAALALVARRWPKIMEESGEPNWVCPHDVAVVVARVLAFALTGQRERALNLVDEGLSDSERVGTALDLVAIFGNTIRSVDGAQPEALGAVLQTALAITLGDRDSLRLAPAEVVAAVESWCPKPGQPNQAAALAAAIRLSSAPINLRKIRDVARRSRRPTKR